MNISVFISEKEEILEKIVEIIYKLTKIKVLTAVIEIENFEVIVRLH